MSTKRRGLSRKMAFNTLLLATSAIGAAFTTPALAQDSEGGLDEIIITGTKRAPDGE